MTIKFGSTPKMPISTEKRPSRRFLSGSSAIWKLTSNPIRKKVSGKAVLAGTDRRQLPPGTVTA